MGRKPGSRNRGYFYRSGRGWVTIDKDGRMLQLRDANGEPLRSKSVPVADLKAARDRIISGAAEVVNAVDVTVEEVCNSYLDKAKESRGENKTYVGRAETLYDFCYGFPPRFMSGKEQPQETDRIHAGFANREAASLTGLDVDRWLAKHPTWNGSKRFHLQAVKRAMNYGVEAGLLKRSPLRGYRVPGGNRRKTYITPEQERALCDATNEPFALALKVLIRTGARPGCEFAALTATHVKDHGERMEWTFQPDESKTGRLRVIRITDPEIIKIVRGLIARHPRGKLFRSLAGEPWKVKNLSLSFRKAKRRATKAGAEFDKGACLYSTRHTYAKRTLQGFWTGRQTNIETLARLMGNSPQVCREHYLQWTETYLEPLWDSA